MTLRQPPLAGVFEGATLTDFGGWEMPVEFDSIRAEHTAVREGVGKFDVSHMGQITVTGPDALELTQRLTTNDVAELEPGDAQYAGITDEEGILLDDTIVYRLPADTEDDYLFIPNAGHDGEMTERWVTHRDEWGLTATVTNRTEEFAMAALQGPDARALLAGETTVDLDSLARLEVASGAVAGVDSLVARSGYTGEDGFEILWPAADAETVWQVLECQPCGLGARDTLRLEMGFLLSGEEFHPRDEPRTPYEAAIGWAVAVDTEFVGRDALAAQEREGVAERLVGLELLDRGVPRHGYEITDADGATLGHVTSGTMSPTLGVPIALAYVPTEHAEPGRELRVVIRGEPKEARTRATPFIDR
ncbi:glycine cleavage system aminomethyltransferase GcvT [Haloarcula onubensis]|uniref:Probable aminomethyltransferase n=1 Tax=Haloarcula onubensis TaxID=2950539 RepID=A0ABU2FSA8_9EURY|nr:glycine cleavage system aminomethyltransferase GcvT [Halomicroarcula sp. S3CR25-11]MDS0283645.1 glycine cleavage system aminomethyltransferase GcvT [Halomicroarcula sp. S3CR25-11]